MLVQCRVTFLSPEEGGRSHSLGYGSLSDYRYRPHFVVGNPQQREAVYKQNACVEDYLGVAFVLGPDIVENHKPLEVLVSLIYHPNVNYELLSVGATFTIREGGRIVGCGEVVEYW